MIVYLSFFGFGTFIIDQHISHWCLIISGPFWTGAASTVRPTSFDQTTESEYESVFFNLELFRESLNFFLLRRLPGEGFFAAMLPYSA